MEIFFKAYWTIIILIGIFFHTPSSADTRFDSLYNLAKNDTSTISADKALREAIQQEEPAWIAKAFYLKGYRYRKHAMYYEALKSYFKALKFYRITENITWQQYTLQNIALIYSDAGFVNESLSVYEDALVLAKKIKNLTVIGDIHYQLAKTHRYLKNYDRAAHYLMLAEKQDSLEDDQIGLYEIKLERWAIASQRKDSTAVMRYASQIDGVQDLPLDYRMRYLNNLGHALLISKQLDSARVTLFQALTDNDTAKVNHEIIAEMYRNLATVECLRGDSTVGIELYEAALAFYDMNKSDVKLVNLIDLLYNVYHKRNIIQRSDEFHHYLADYTRNMTQLYEQVKKAHIQYQVQAATYKYESEMHEEALAQQRMWFYSGLAVTSIIVLVLILLYHHQTRQKQKVVKKVVEDIDSLLNVKRVS